MVLAPLSTWCIFGPECILFRVGEPKKLECFDLLNQDSKVWDKLWHANIPTKLRHFGWMALHHGLAMREMLFRRGFDIEWVCPMYGEGNEMVLHDLILYPESNLIRRSSPLHLSFQTTPQESFMGWVQTLTHEYKADAWWDLFWSLLWGLCLRRNRRVFDGKRVEGL